MYIHVHLYLSTKNKSVMTFNYVNKTCVWVKITDVINYSTQCNYKKY